MCGISGVIGAPGGGVHHAIAAMNRVQAHRGPDDEGAIVIEEPHALIGFGHRRLSILDLSSAGRQPMTNPRTGDVITYNGEIYNSPELRAELEASGSRFRGQSDTEVILAAYERWGIACLDRLHGMFGFGLYAAREHRVYLARDPLGIKPLYYAQTRNGVAFASELRGLIASGLVNTRSLDRRAVATLLAYGAVTSPLTMLQEARQLQPGHWAFIDVSRPLASMPEIRPTRWWSPPQAISIARNDNEVGRVLAPALQAGIRRHLLSDVPVAVFLSSGIDSAAIASIAGQARDGDLDTFTITLGDDWNNNEGDLAARIACDLGVRHQSVRLESAEAPALIESWMASVDQPTVDGLNTYAIAKAVRDHGFKVALSGLGGDELFGGYRSFHSVPWAARASAPGQWVPASARATLASLLTAGKSATARRKAKDFALTHPDLVSYALLRRRLFSNEQMRALMGRDTDEHQGLDDGFMPDDTHKSYEVKASPWATVRSVELYGYMANMLLRDSDVFGMAHGLEIRVPLLDRRLVDETLGYARRWRSFSLCRPHRKPWLVAAAGTHFPRITARRPKRGFTIPIACWMNGPFRPQLEDHIEWLAGSGLLESGAVRSAWSDFLREPHSQAWSRAWMLGVLAQWLQNLRSPATRHSSLYAVP